MNNSDLVGGTTGDGSTGVGVMHMLDSLAIGGAERAAVNLANELPRDRYRSFLCTTRKEGPLRDAVASDVVRLALARHSRFDAAAVRRLVQFIASHRVAILHAHGSSLFVAAVAACFPPYPIVLWHAHYGRLAAENRRAWAHRIALTRAAAVITVNRELATWCNTRLGIPAEKIRCLPNMAPASAPVETLQNLPGNSGSRIVCVANLREEKDHLNLIRAMALVKAVLPKAHLILVGAQSDPARSDSYSYFEQLKNEIARYSLERHISFLGQRRDVPAILGGCDVGVLSSRTEGLPLSLLEYGSAGLAVVATQVGECAEVLDGGRAGILVSPQSPSELAEGLLFLLQSPEQRVKLGAAFHRRVQTVYSASTVIGQICQVYDSVLLTRHSLTASAERYSTSAQV